MAAAVETSTAAGAAAETSTAAATKTAMISVADGAGTRREITSMEVGATSRPQDPLIRYLRYRYYIFAGSGIY
jgi:hypothetical protein